MAIDRRCSDGNRIVWADELRQPDRTISRLQPAGMGDHAFTRALDMLAHGAEPKKVAFIVCKPVAAIDALAHAVRHWKGVE
jgi:hypothetical protein